VITQREKNVICMLLIPTDSGYTVEYDFDTNVLKNETQNEVPTKEN